MRWTAQAEHQAMALACILDKFGGVAVVVFRDFLFQFMQNVCVIRKSIGSYCKCKWHNGEMIWVEAGSSLLCVCAENPFKVWAHVLRCNSLFSRFFGIPLCQFFLFLVSVSAGHFGAFQKHLLMANMRFLLAVFFPEHTYLSYNLGSFPLFLFSLPSLYSILHFMCLCNIMNGLHHARCYSHTELHGINLSLAEKQQQQQQQTNTKSAAKYLKMCACECSVKAHKRTEFSNTMYAAMHTANG